MAASKKKSTKTGTAAKAAAAVKRAGVAGLNKPKKTPSHPTKKAVVVVKDGDSVKTIRFGDQKMGHNYSPEARASFKARHAKNIAKGKTSAAYWADRVFWAGPSGDKKNPPASQKTVKGSPKGKRSKK